MDLKHVLGRMSGLLMAGVVGGIVGSLLTPSSTALAQGKKATKGPVQGEAIPEVVKAQAFQLVDGEGRKWAELALTYGPTNGPELVFYDQKGGRVFHAYSTRPGLSTLDLRDGNDENRVSLHAGAGSALVFIESRDPLAGKSASSDRRFIGLTASSSLNNTALSVHGSGASIKLMDSEDGPAVTLYEGQQERATLGTTRLTAPSGSTEIRSAASLVLFSKEGRVAWRAPVP